MEFEARKVELSLTLMNAIESTITGLLQDSSCPRILSIVGQYLRDLQSNQLWPLAKVLQQANLALIFSRILSFQEPTVTSCSNTFCRSCKDLNLTGKLSNEKEKILNIKVGLCLDCVKTGRQSLREQVCRIKHV